MSIQTCTTILTHRHDAAAQLDAAIAFARAADTHLHVLSMGIGFDHFGVGYGAMDAVPSPAAIEQALDQAQALADIATARLGNEDIRWDVDMIVTGSAGLPFEMIRHIRFSDLVVQARPEGAQTGDGERIAQAVLFHADVPFLMLPSGPPIKAPARKIMLAWDQSSAALRAARQGLPFLKRATRVNIALIDPPCDAPDRSDPGGAFAQFLARHGVKCDVSVMASGQSTVAETLGRRAQETGCDMMVMGAYGHTRLREAIFGGTTRTMLEGASLPILFAH